HTSTRPWRQGGAPHQSRARDRAAGGIGPDEPGDRRAAVPLGADGRQSSGSDLREARCLEPCRAGSGTRSEPARAVTPRQLEMVRSSYAALGDVAPTMAADFYRRLFEADPSARELFSAGREFLSVKFAAELAAIVEAITSYETFSSRVHDLAVRHAQYGVLTHHYRAAGQA